MFLHSHGVLSLRSAVRGSAGREGDPAVPDGGMEQADCPRYGLPPQSEDYPQRSQVTKVSPLSGSCKKI